MYTLRQNSFFTDELELQKSDGSSEILTININITPDLVGKYRKLQVRLIDLQKQSNATSNSTERAEEIGKAVVDVFSLLFGEENCKKIIEFYYGDFVQMASSLFPYIQNFIVPKFQEISRQRKQAFKRRNWK